MPTDSSSAIDDVSNPELNLVKKHPGQNIFDLKKLNHEDWIKVRKIEFFIIFLKIFTQ